MRRPCLAITTGEPAGIGPEIVRRALADPRCPRRADFLVLGADIPKHVVPGCPSTRSARLAWHALEQSVKLLRRGQVQGIVTAPIDKANLARVGFPYPGHTEFFADRLGYRTDDPIMVMYDRRLVVGLATAHCSLREALRRLKPLKIVRVAQALHDLLRRLHPARPPRIALAALNPHAGENGLFGSEEKTLLLPALQLAQKQGLALAGPYSADTLFYRALQGECDAVVCLYHDQALIPFKLVAFHTGVNVTLGLPIVRTSPDHGTAYDLAGTGRANPSSMLSAMRLACRLISGDHYQSIKKQAD